MMAELKLEHIYKQYDKNIIAVQDFNLHIKDKEFIIFVGPSRCGKSTTLRMIAGLAEISKGNFFIEWENPYRQYIHYFPKRKNEIFT